MVFNVTSEPLAAVAASPVTRVEPTFTTMCKAGGLSFPWGRMPDPSVDYGLNQPTKVAADQAGDVFVLDSGNGVIRKYANDGTRTMTIVAGGGLDDTFLGRDDLRATENHLIDVSDIAVDPTGSTLYLVEHEVIRSIDLATGDIATIAGIRNKASSPIPADGTSAAGQGIGEVVSISVGTNRLYVFTPFFVDEIGSPGRLFSIELAGANAGAISVVAGGASLGTGIDESALSLETQSVPGTSLHFVEGYALEVDAVDGRVYWVTGAGRLFQLDPSNGFVKRFAGRDQGLSPSGDGGSSRAAQIPRNVGLAAYDGLITIAQPDADRLRQFIANPLGDSTMFAYAGDGVAGFDGDDRDVVGTSDRFAHPNDVAVDGNGNVYVADTFNHRVRMIDPSGTLSTVAGGINPVSDLETPYVGVGVGGSANGLLLQDIGGLAADDAGGYFVADNAAHRIYYIDANGRSSVFAGSGRQRFISDAWINGEPAINHDFGSLLHGGGTMGKLRFVNIFGRRYLYLFEGYLAQSGSLRLVRIAIDDPSHPVATIIGNGDYTSNIVDGQPAAERGGLFSTYAVATNGDVYVANGRGGQIWKVDGFSGIVNKWAGAATTDYDYEVTAGGGNRLTEKVGLVLALDVAADGTVYYSAQARLSNATRIFKVGADNKVVLIGGSTNHNDIVGTDGEPAVGAHLITDDIRVDSAGSVFLKDSYVIRRIDPTNGKLFRVMGPFEGTVDDARHTLGEVAQPAQRSRSDYLADFDIATDGTMLFAEDYRNVGDIGFRGLLPLPGVNRIRRLVPDGSCDKTTSVPTSTATSLTMVNSMAWNPSPNGRVYSVAATPDMSYIAYAYVPSANDALPGRPNVTNVYLFNRLTGSTELVNLAADGQPDRGDEDGVLLSGEGAAVDVAVRATDGHVLVAFVSQAGLVADDTDTLADVYVKDVTDGTLVMVSRDSSGDQLNGSDALGPVLADDGTFLTLTYLLVGDKRQLFKKFLTDPLLVQLNFGDGTTTDASIAGDGTSVVYVTDVSNSNYYAGNGSPQIVQEDTSPFGMRMISEAAPRTPGNGTSQHPQANFDGSVIAYESNASNLGAIRNDVLVHRAGQANLSLNSVRNGPPGDIDRVSAISADGTKLIVQEATGSASVRRQRPWLVDISGVSVRWQPLDGAGPNATLPVSSSDDDAAGASYAAVDDAGRRVAVVTPHDLGLQRAVEGTSQLYLRDLHPFDATPAITVDRAAVNIVGTTNPSAARILADNSIVYWSNGELVRRDAGGAIATLTSGLGGPHPMAVGAGGAVYFALGRQVWQARDNVQVLLGVTPQPVTNLGYNPRDDRVYASAGPSIYLITGQVAVNVVNASQRAACAPTAHGSPPQTGVCEAGPLDFDAKGVLYFVDSAPCAGTANCSRIRRVQLGLPNARVTTIAGMIGPTTVGEYEDGVDARTTPLGQVSDIAVAPDGSVYVAEFGRNRVRRIAPNSVITTVVGNGDTGAVLPANALDGHQQPSSVDVAANGAIVFASDITDQINMIVNLQTDLTSTTSVYEPGVAIVPTKELASSAIDPPTTQSSQSVIDSVGVGAIGADPLAPGLAASPLRSIPLRSIPLRSIALGSIPLRSISISQIPLDFPGGWAAVLVGTPLAGRPLQSVSLDDVLNPALDTNLTLPAAPYNLNNIPIGALDLSSTPLRSIAIAAIALGSTPLRSIPLPTSVVPKAGPGDVVLRQWCALIEANFLSCADLGVDAQNANSSDGVSLVSLNLAGIPLRSIPLRSIPLRSIDLSASPLRSIPLRSIDLQASPLRSIPLRSIALASAPLRSIPLRSIPLRSIDLNASPLRSIPLRSIGSVADIVDCLRVDCSPGSIDTLASAADLLPTAIRDVDTNGDPVTLWQLILAMSVADFAPFVLGDLKAYGDVTIGDLIDALPGDAPYTLEDLLKALIPIADYPWENLDLGKTAEMWRAASTPGSGGRAGRLIHYAVDINLDNPVPFSTDAHAEVILPPGYSYLPGSAVVHRGGVVDTPIADPTGAGPLTFIVPGVVGGDQLAFDVVPGLEFGTGSTTLTLSTTNAPLTRTASFGTSIAGEWEEQPLGGTADPPQLQPDTIAVGHIASSADTDLYKVAVSEGQTMSVILSNLPADFDVTLYAPVTTPLANRVAERALVPIQDEAITLPGAPTAAPADPANDLSLDNAVVYAVGQRRDAGDERIDTGRLRAGIYYLKVTGFNEASSTKPYALRVTLQTPTSTVPPCATWDFRGDSVQRGALPPSGAFAGVNTIMVVNRERLFGKFPGDAASVMTGLSNFVTATNASPAMGVKALVVPIDGDNAVHDAYGVWETGANRCDPIVARDVASQIATTLDAILAANPQIQNVVMVGGDDLIPHGRVPDLTHISNEREFAQELDGNNELVASARGAWTLTDDIYVDRAPVTVGTAELYVPNVALGRLVETPAEIIAALDDFVTNNGNLDAKTALSTGYDFLADGAGAVKSALVKNGFTTDANAAGLIGETWTAQNLKDALLGLNGFNVPDIAAVNAHYDDSRSLPADENTNPTPTNLFTTADLPVLRTLARSLLFSVGCHGGLNVADATQPLRGKDWAQSYAGQGAVWIGNTGFGYGDTEVVAASEKLMALFAEQLNGKFTVGQALLLAKQGYVGDLGTVITSYDIKVSQQVTFYGLPMYRLSATAGVPDPPPSPRAVTTDLRVGLESAPLAVSTPVADPEFPTPDQPGALSGHVGARGTYYTVDGDALTVQNRPIQPRTTRDVTRVSPTTGLPLGTATGMLVTQLTSQDRFGVNPSVYRPIVDSSAETEPPTVENIFPSAPVSIGNFTDLATVGGQTVPIARQQVVIIPGQFRGNPAGGTGTQRLFTNVNGVVYYAPPTNTDTTPPAISFADAAVAGTSASFTVRTADSGDPTRVKRVFVLAIPANQSGASVSWLGVDLSLTAPGTWTGGITIAPSTPGVEFIVQVVDAAGNIGVSSNKGALYQDQPPSTPSPDAPVVTVDPASPASGWFAAQATVTVTDPHNLTLSYSIDRGPETAYVTPFAVSGAGAHQVVARNSAGRATTARVSIDNTAPTTQCATPAPTWSGANVSVSCVATDDGIGLANASDQQFALTTNVPANAETADAVTDGRAVCDALDHCSTAGPFIGIKVDRKAPMIAIASPANAATYALGQIVDASYSCVDGGSGVASCSGSTAAGAAVDTATAGVKTFVVTATDAVGNAASTTLTYTVVAANAAPVVAADMGVSGLQEIGYPTGIVVLTGSIRDPDGPGPYTASVRWAPGGPFTPLILNNSTKFVAATFYPTPGLRTATVRVCDAGGHCGTDDVAVRTQVSQRITPTRCVADRGSSANPRYEARFGYGNPAPFAIFVPTIPTIENTFTTGTSNRGQPQVFLPGNRANAFSVRFNTGTMSWRVNGTTVSASATSPTC
jgi:NHL repeat